MIPTVIAVALDVPQALKERSTLPSYHVSVEMFRQELAPLLITPNHAL
jgi:hypothetical protein